MNLLPKSLYVRLVLIAALGTTLSICSLGGYIAYEQKKLAITAAYQKATLVTTGVANSIASHLIEKNYTGIEESIKQAAIYPTIESLQVINAKGISIISLTKNADNSFRLKHGGKVVLPVAQTLRSTLEAEHIRTWAPVNAGDLIGWIRTDLTLSNIAAAQREILLDTSIIALASILFSVLISCLVLRRPIRQIRQAAHFASTLPEKHSQSLFIKNATLEVNQLASSLNSAAYKLSEQDNELQLLNSLIQYSADPVFILDVEDDFRLIFINDAACKHFGLSREELLTRGVFDLNADADEFSITRFWQQLKNSKHLLFESCHKTADAKIVPVQISANYLRYREKELVAGYFTDISVRKQMEEALRHSEQRLQEIINIMPIAVFVKDPLSNILMMNKICEQQWNVDFKQMRGTTGQQVFDALQLRKFLIEDREVFAEKQLLEIDEQIWNASLKEYRFLHTYKKPVLDEAGNPLYLIGISVDVTETKQQEEKLRLAKNEAERANQAKSEFLANMSHEIRTPLNAVINFSYLLMQTHLQEKQRDYVGKIDLAGKNLLGVINDILDFSKIEAGKLELESQLFDLNELFSQLYVIITSKIQHKNQSLYFHYQVNSPHYLVGDALRLSQVLLNLCTNAVKFTQNGEVLVTTTVLEQSNETVLLEFAVKDTGIGLSPEQIQDLFQPFKQADNSMTRRYGGTGLGLSICKRLVEMLGGTISVESSLNEGSTFRFTAQFGCPEQQNIKPYTKIDFSNKEMLVVDDKYNDRESLLVVLKSFGITVKTVANGLEALDLIRKKQQQGVYYDAIFLDWKMPDMDGLEIASSIIYDIDQAYRKNIIIVTAYDTDLIKEQSAELGLKNFLEKPITVSNVFNMLVDQIDFKSLPLTVGSQSKQEIQQLTDMHQAKILLVEDNRMNQQIVQELLLIYGLSVDIAENGLEAIAKIKETPYQLVFMDIQMPEMDGYQTTKMIREELHNQDLPIVAMTAHAMKDEIAKCLDIGMNAHLSKPVDPAKLFAALLKWIPAAQAPVKQIAEPNQNNVDYSELEGLRSIAKLEKGLFYVNYNQTLYYQILENFYYEQRLHFDAIDIASQDYKTLRYKVHSLKGVAGSLGMEKLFDCASALEQALAAGQPDPINRLLPEYIKGLHTVLTTLSDWLIKHTHLFYQSGLTIDFDREQVLSIVKKMQENLEEDLAMVKELILELKPMLQNHPDYKESFLALETNLAEFDTEAAAQVLEQLITQINKA